MSSLQYFGSQGNDLHESLFSQLSGDRSEDTGAYGLLILVDDNGCVLVELDVAAVCSSGAGGGSYDNGLNDLSLLDDAAGGRVFYGTYDDVTDISLLTACAAEDTDAEEFLCSGIVGNLQSGFCLDHLVPPYLTFSTISTSLHLLDLDRGLVSMILTLSPIWHSLFSS